MVHGALTNYDWSGSMVNIAHLRNMLRKEMPNALHRCGPGYLSKT